MTKICAKCGAAKDLGLFSRDSRGALGRKSRCKECLFEYYTEWSSRPGVSEKKVIWCRDHAKNNPVSKLVYSARERAKKDGLVCSITAGDIVIPEMCPILGVLLERGSRSSHDSSPSLDRLVPELGYTAENVRVVSYRANRLKNDATAEEHRTVAGWMTNPRLRPFLVPSRTVLPRNIKFMLNGARRRSKKLGLVCDLTLSDIVVPDVCPILGVRLFSGVGVRNRSNASPSLDRINPSGGYVQGNVAVMSYRANRIKNDGTAEEHRKIADWMDEQMQNCEPMVA